jgi:hypothetical protein
MELSIVTKTSVVDFMQFTWRQIGLLQDAFIAVMKKKQEAE